MVVVDWFDNGGGDSYGGAGVGKGVAAAAAAVIVEVAVPKMIDEPPGAWPVAEGMVTRPTGVLVVVVDWFNNGGGDSYGGAGVGKGVAAVAAAATAAVPVLKIIDEPPGAWPVAEGTVTRPSGSVGG